MMIMIDLIKTKHSGVLLACILLAHIHLDSRKLIKKIAPAVLANSLMSLLYGKDLKLTPVAGLFFEDENQAIFAQTNFLNEICFEFQVMLS